jgi:lauroyl/myristoyl acyltransferase
MPPRGKFFAPFTAVEACAHHHAPATLARKSKCALNMAAVESYGAQHRAKLTLGRASNTVFFMAEANCAHQPALSMQENQNHAVTFIGAT